MWQTMQGALWLIALAMSLTACAATPVSSDAGCRTYFENSRGLIGDADAPQTPLGVIRRAVVLDTAMRAACDE